MSFWEEPTFTIEEFVYSWHPMSWVPNNIEQLMYFNIKMGMLVGPWALRTAYFVRQGMLLADAGYLASQNSLSIYRWMTKPQRTMSQLTRIGALPIAVSLFGRHVLDEYGSAEFQTDESGRTPLQQQAHTDSQRLISVLGQTIGKLNPFK